MHAYHISDTARFAVLAVALTCVRMGRHLLHEHGSIALSCSMVASSGMYISRAGIINSLRKARTTLLIVTRVVKGQLLSRHSGHASCSSNGDPAVRVRTRTGGPDRSQRLSA